MEAELIGRDDELQRVQRFLEGVATGTRALLIAGEAGVGKTSLWQAAVASASAAGHRVVAARPTEAETSFAHAALSDLLGPHPEVLEDLPGPQRRALEVALLMADGTAGPDQRAVSLATLAAVRALARTAPLTIAVDDVQWLDRSSAAVLGFAARRLNDEPIGLLVAQRAAGEAPVPLDLDRAPAGDRLDHLILGPLSLGAVQRLLQHRLGWVPSRPVLLHVHELAGGNPFFALELGRAVQAGTLHLRPGERLPVTLEALVGARLRDLSPETGRGLAVAAAMRQPTLAIVNAVAGDDALAAAEDAQIVHVRDGVVHFAHPLLASGAYTATDPATRRALHTAIAELAGEPEERALHLALAATGPDEAVAGALDDAGRRALSRGAPAAAADLFERAVQLTPPGHPGTVGRRRTDAAACVFQSGDSRRARELLGEVLRTTGRGPARARALVRLALVRGYDDDLRAAEALLREAIENADGDGEPMAEAHCHMAGILFRLRERLREAVEHAAAAASGAVASGRVELQAEALSARLLPEAALGDPRAVSTLRRALELDARGRHDRVIARPLFQAAFTWLWWDELERARTAFETLHAQAAELGDESSLAYVLVLGAQIDCVRGDVTGARRHADGGRALAEQTGQATVGAYLLALRALADAIAGDLDEGRERAERALAAAARTNGRPAEHFARAALGLLEQSAGRPAEVVRALGPLVAFLRAEQIAEPGAARIVPEHVEALIALRELDAAEELLAWFEGNARRLERASALAAAARCRGLLAGARGDVDGALARLQEALELHDGVPIPLELGRTRLAYGSALRRARQKAAARTVLGAAADGFEAVGARVWAGRARAELAAVGGRPPSSGALTPTERRVAELVAEGLQTKQVAARLFVSPKTVEGHLSHIYAKLGVHSRTELAHRLGHGDPARG
jgi:DNA-binding CsgD family transcriptional regulator/tetratricopeptide (TPR) repeat protein